MELFDLTNLFFLPVLAINVLRTPSPQVKIDQGILTGVISSDGLMYEYHGIPYAVIDTKHRFQAPLPAPKWEGVKKAIDEHSFCPQKIPIGYIGDEDCLKINVYVPIKTQRPIPIMVYIHGGKFLFGNGGKWLYGPDFLVQHNVVLVTFNYRVGPLGFICLGTRDAPGNAALKDQLAALRWVKKNIAAFGGDPDNITLFGESAGSACASLLVASPTTDGLFNKAILQSGTSIANWAVDRDPIFSANLLMQALGYNKTKDPNKIYKYLSAVEVDELVKVEIKRPLRNYFEPDINYLPCVEKPIPGVEAVVTDLPYNMLKSINRKNVSVIYGTNNREGIYFLEEATDKTLAHINKGNKFASDLDFPSRQIMELVSDKVQKFYFGDKPISFKTLMNISELYSDIHFEVPALLESEIFLESSNLPVYNYYFEYEGQRNAVKLISKFHDYSGAFHGDDVLYLFEGRIFPLPINEEDRAFINKFSKLFANFAKYGNPTPANDTLLQFKWEPSRKENIQLLYLGKEFKMGPIPKPEAYQLWRSIYSKYRKRTWGY